MTDVYTSAARRTEDRLRATWLAAIIIIVVFFVCNHTLTAPLDRNDDTGIQARAAEVADAIGGGSLSRQIALTALGAYGAALIWTTRNRETRRGAAVRLLMFTLLAWAVASVAWSSVPLFTLRKVFALLMLALGAWGVARVFSVPRVAILTAISCGFFLALGVAAELACRTFAPLDSAYRFGGTLHPNPQASNCALLAMACLYLMRSLPRFRRALALAALVAITFLLLTRSRTALAAFACGGLVYSMFISSRVTKLAATASAALIAAVILTLLAGGSSVVSEQSFLLGRADSDPDTLSGRTELWDAVSGYAKEALLVGHGFDSFWTPAHVEDISSSQHWVITEAHSAYLELILGIGVIGLALYLALLASGATDAWALERRLRDGRYAFLCALLAFAVVESSLESAMVGIDFPAFLTVAALGVLATAPVEEAPHRPARTLRYPWRHGLAVGPRAARRPTFD